jgi:conjugative relaxase-like TrwC/TraI family protein
MKIERRASLETGNVTAEPIRKRRRPPSFRSLKGEVTRASFLALASNKVPGTEENLTVRTKDKRTAGYDFCHSVPKSVSVYLALSGDRAVERMIGEAFRETMVDVEARMETQVRGADEGGIQRGENRITGNILYAAFVHTVSRPIDGSPDRTKVTNQSRSNLFVTDKQCEMLQAG